MKNATNSLGMTQVASQIGRRSGRRPQNWIGLAQAAALAKSPSVWIFAFVAVSILSFLIPVTVPVGSFYWDIVLYPDAAWRIANGQTPHVDFFAPAGALPYYIYALLDAIFPNGSMLLLANWSVMVVALPLMVHVAAEMERSSRTVTLAFVLPFLAFAALPLNTTSQTLAVGADGFGLYNRHTVLLLYILVGEIVLVRSRKLSPVFTACMLLALFFVKITGFIIGAALIAHAVLAGRMQLKSLIAASAIVLAFLVAIDLPTGIVYGYLANVGELIAMNQTDLLKRLRDPLIVQFDIVFPALLLVGALVWSMARNARSLQPAATVRGLIAQVRNLADTWAAWLASVLIAGIIFESQNTGSLEFVHIWPVILGIILAWAPQSCPPKLRRVRIAILLLAAIVALPTAVHLVYRSTRVVAVAFAYPNASLPNLGKLGIVSAKKDFLVRAPMLNQHYATFSDAFSSMAIKKQNVIFNFYAEPDFQLAWMLAASQAVTAIEAYEKKNSVRFDEMMMLDFIDPVTYNMKRKPVRTISIGMSEGRTIPPLTSERRRAVEQADAILSPRCPVTSVQVAIKKAFAPVLNRRTKVNISPCWDVYLRPSPIRGSAKTTVAFAGSAY